VIRWETTEKPYHVTVRLPDGGGRRLPVEWTDLVEEGPSDSGQGRFCVESLRAMTTVVAALLQRERSSIDS